MNKFLALGMLAGVIVGLILVAVILKVTKTDGRMKCAYDERQAIIRGKGFRLSFAVLAIYNAIYGMVGVAVDKMFLDPLAAMFIGICLSISVHVVYCIWNDAYFSLNENPKRVLVAFGALAAVNLALGIYFVADGKAVVDGVLSFRSANLMAEPCL